MKCCTIILLLMFCGQVDAKEKIDSMFCSKSNEDLQIYLKLNDLQFENEKISAELGYFTLSIINHHDLSYDYYPTFSTGTFVGEKLQNVRYNGSKYKNYFKFQLVSSESKQFTGEGVESVDLLFSPKYKVVKTIPQNNNWDKKWTWDVEIREYKAVLPINLNNHHGNYIPLNCFASKKVNEQRPDL